MRQHRIKAERGVAFAKNENVALRPLRIFRVMLHRLIDGAQHFDDGKGRGNVTVPARARRGQDIFSDVPALWCHWLDSIARLKKREKSFSVKCEKIQGEVLFIGSRFVQLLTKSRN